MSTTHGPDVSGQDNIRAQQQTCLELFVLRARRVEEHSLAADPQQVVRWAEHEMTMEAAPGGRTWLIQRLPAEELLESAAARVRPFILQRDPIHYGKVLTAIGYLLSPEERAAAAPTLAQLRKMWKQVNPNSREVRAYSVQVGKSDGDTAASLTSDQLAFAWIYGDTVHADAVRQAEAEPFGIRERYRAAAGIVAELIINTVATLNVVRALHAGELLTLGPGILDRDVVVKDTELRHETDFYIGSPGAIPPRPGEPPGPGWQPLDRSLAAEASQHDDAVEEAG